MNLLRVKRKSNAPRKVFRKANFLLQRRLRYFYQHLPFQYGGRKWLKRLSQKWKWRWNRKSSNVWKRVRFLQKYDSNSICQFRVKKSFMSNQILLNALLWRYGVSKKQITNYRVDINTRLDSVLVALRYARNITNSRQLLQSSRVAVNGKIVQNGNLFVKIGDIIQLKGRWLTNKIYWGSISNRSLRMRFLGR